MPPSPYSGVPQQLWYQKTVELVEGHPLRAEEAVEVVLECWESIFSSRIGGKGFRVGTHLFPKPQIMGFFLHELIPLELSARHPGSWRPGTSKGEKDVVYVPSDRFSIEIKTSSHPSQVFGNRSFAQKRTSALKEKSGYYLAVNFEKFEPKVTTPRIRRIRFGWLDHEDWLGQKAPTGQQARLAPSTEQGKLVILYQLK